MAKKKKGLPPLKTVYSDRTDVCYVWTCPDPECYYENITPRHEIEDRDYSPHCRGCGENYNVLTVKPYGRKEE